MVNTRSRPPDPFEIGVAIGAKLLASAIWTSARDPAEAMQTRAICPEYLTPAQAAGLRIVRIDADEKIVTLRGPEGATRSARHLGGMLGAVILPVGRDSAFFEVPPPQPLTLPQPSYDKERGFGRLNRGYANAEVDRLTEAALPDGERDRRLAAQRQAMRIAMDETGVVPLHIQSSLWATRKGFRLLPNPEEHTLAFRVLPE